MFQRPFTLIEDIQREAEQEFRAKERELLNRLSETEEQLAQLQTEARGDGAIVLSQEQKAAIERFRDETIRIRRELRDVQFQLRKDVEQVNDWVRAINIAAMPALVAIFAIGLALVRRGRRRAVAA